MKKIIYALFVFFVLLGFMPVVKADTDYAPFTIIANPGEDAQSEIRLSYQTWRDVVQTEVMYTEKSDTDWLYVKTIRAIGVENSVFDGMSSKDASGNNVTENGKLMDYNVSIKDLKPDTEYMYKVKAGKESDVHYFKTAGDKDFSFVWISDFHSYLPIPNRLKVSAEMVNTILKYDPEADFVLSTGDDVAWGGSYSFWRRMYEESYIKDYMHVACIGNHDYMDRTSEKSSIQFFNTVCNNPTNGYAGEEGVSFWFIYSNTLFFFLDNETLNTTTSPKCIEWMRQVVNEHPTQYIIMVSHYQSFSGGNGSFAANYNRFYKFCDEVGVDLFLTGNNHIYLRSKSLYDGKVSTDPSLGTVYIQAPSSDNERGQDMGELTYNTDLVAARFTEGGRTIGGSSVKINPDRILVTLLDRNGTVVDTVAILPKRNSFDMSGFNRQEFMQNLEFRKSSLADDSILLKMDESAIDYIYEVKVLNGEKELLSFKPTTKRSLVQYINDLPLNKIYDLQLMIHYKDNSKEKIPFELNLYNEKFEYLHIGYDEYEDMMAIRYFYDNPDAYKYYIYINNELYMQTADYELLLPRAKFNSDNLIRVDAVNKNRVVIASITGKMDLYGDANFDGYVNNDDIIDIKNAIIGSKNVDQKMADLNSDGTLSLQDLIILKLKIEKDIDLIKKKEYTITFNFLEHTETVIVSEGEIPEIDVSEEYDFASFDKELAKAFSNETYNAIYEIAPKSIAINGSTNVTTNTDYTYTITFSPAYSCTAVEYEVDSEYVRINRDGTFTFIKEGVTQIKAISKANGVSYTLNITITKGGSGSGN